MYEGTIKSAADLDLLPRLVDEVVLSVAGLKSLSISNLCNLKRLIVDSERSLHLRLDQLPSLSILDCKKAAIEKYSGVERLDALRLADTGTLESYIPDTSSLSLSRINGDLVTFADTARLRTLSLRMVRNIATLLDKIPIPEDVLEIEFYPQRFDSLDSLLRFKNLTKLSLIDCGEINTITWIAELRNLKHLNIGGATTIRDGNVACILDHISVSEVLFQNRKHYNAMMLDYNFDVALLRRK